MDLWISCSQCHGNTLLIRHLFTNTISYDQNYEGYSYVALHAKVKKYILLILR